MNFPQAGGPATSPTTSVPSEEESHNLATNVLATGFLLGKKSDPQSENLDTTHRASYEL